MNDIERINKQTELIKEVLVEFLETMKRENSMNLTPLKKLTELKTKLNQPIEPTQPEGYQGLNKWYKTSGGHIIYAVELNKFSCYGVRVKTEFNRETHWCNDFALQLNFIDRLATDTEIKEAILKGCEQNGIVEGAVCKWGDGNTFKITMKDILYSKGSNKLFQDVNKNLNLDARTLFDNGKFAGVVKEDKPTEYTKEQKEQFYKEIEKMNKQPFQVVNSTDKELLKECRIALNDIIKMDYLPRHFDSTQGFIALLTKLNKHLNHE